MSDVSRIHAGTTTVYYRVSKAGYATVTGSTTITIGDTEATLTYNANGHGTAPAAVTMKYSEAAAAGSMTDVTGYTFLGWATTKARADASTVDYETGDTIKTANAVPSDMTLWGVWQVNNYNIVYNLSGGSGSFSNTTRDYGTTYTLPDEVPTKTDHRFTGWSVTGEDGLLDPGDSFTVAGDTTITANWTHQNTITVTVEWHDGKTGSAANNRPLPVLSLRKKPTRSAPNSSPKKKSVETAEERTAAFFDEESGVLTFRRTEEVLESTEGRIVFDGIDSLDEQSDTPWAEYRNDISKVVVEDKFSPSCMASWFEGCENLEEAELKELDTSNVTDMSNLFKGCASLKELDLSGFDTECLEKTSGMFEGCENLEVIYASERWNLAALEKAYKNAEDEDDRDTISGNMFGGCVKLSGYDEEITGHISAHTGEGGYLTYKPDPDDTDALEKWEKQQSEAEAVNSPKTEEESALSGEDVTGIPSGNSDIASDPGKDENEEGNEGPDDGLQHEKADTSDDDRIISTSLATRLKGNIVIEAYAEDDGTVRSSDDESQWSIIDDDTWTYTFIVDGEATDTYDLWESTVPDGYTTDTGADNIQVVGNGTATLSLRNSITYTVTFDPRGGTFESTTNTTEKTVAYGETDNNSPGVATKAGYAFNGWYTATSDGDQVFDSTGSCVSGDYWSASGSTGVWQGDDDLTVYAQWAEHTATLTYNANGHGTAPAAVTMRYTAATTAASSISSGDGHYFLGWNTESDGSGTMYQPGNTVKAANVEPSAVTLYAQWGDELPIPTGIDAHGIIGVLTTIFCMLLGVFLVIVKDLQKRREQK